MDYRETKVRLYLWIGILVSVIVACSALYTIYLINRSGMVDWDKEESTVDIYQIKLEQYLGVGGSNYEERPLYTDEQFEADQRNIVQALAANRFDSISDLANSVLAKYKFDDDKIATWSALESAYIFDEEYQASSEGKISLVAKIQDPILYIRFFLLLSLDEQRSLIQYDSVNILPSFTYDTIVIDEVEMTMSDPMYSIIKSESYYRLTLTYAGHNYYIDMINNGYCSIFRINNETGSMNTQY